MKLFDGKVVIFTGEYSCCNMQKFKDSERKNNTFYKTYGTIDHFAPGVQISILKQVLQNSDENILFGTNSMFVLEQLNIMLARYQFPENEPKGDNWFAISPDNLSIRLYQKDFSGEFEELVRQDEEGLMYVDTLYFADAMERLYGEYENTLEPYEDTEE